MMNQRIPPQRLLGAISWILFVAVIFGGESLLRFLSGGDNLTDHQEQFFRAGHAHAGVLTIVGLLYSLYLGKTALSHRTQYAAWTAYAIGVGGVAGGMFLHAYTGEPGESSAGTTLAAIGGILVSVMVLYLAWNLIRHPAEGDRS